MKRRGMSTLDHNYARDVRSRLSLDQMDTIDLTRLTPSPGPSTSNGINRLSFGPDLYSQLQNLENQEGVIRNTDFVFCTICDHFIDIHDAILVRNCLHQICVECIRKTIIGCGAITVICPATGCEYPMQDREIQCLLTQEEYEKHMNKPAEIEKHEHLYQELLDLEQQGLIHNTESFECGICFTDIDVNQGIHIRECLHQYCKDCLRSTINLSEEIHIKCPTTDCVCYIHDREIHALLTHDEYDKYSAKTLRIAETQAPNSYHCKKPNCEGWCFVDDEVNFFDCPRCSSRNCLPCQAIHPRQNCKQYQEELKYFGKTDDERSQMCLDEIVQKELGMRCPACKVVIMKRQGCDFLICSMCKTELCWARKMARWGPGGRGDTSGGCGCSPIKRCHPKCGNCH